MHIEFISAHVSAFIHTKPGYYVNIVWLKGCVLHNWLHTHSHTQTHSTFRFYLFRFLVIRVGQNIEYIGTLLSSHTRSFSTHSRTRSRSFLCMFGKFVAKMRIRLLTLLFSHSLAYFCSLSFISNINRSCIYVCVYGPDYIIHTEHNYSMNCFPMKKKNLLNRYNFIIKICICDISILCMMILSGACLSEAMRMCVCDIAPDIWSY